MYTLLVYVYLSLCLSQLYMVIIVYIIVLLYTNLSLSVIDIVILEILIKNYYLFIDIISNLNLNNILTILSINVYSCPRYKKRMKSTYGLTRHINKYISK